MPTHYDVFLSHNSRDKPTVEKIGEWLRSQNLTVWLDKWELRPGLPWQEELEEGAQTSKAVAVFLGESGLGAWQEPEMRAFIARSRHETLPVIPVLLPSCPDSPELTLFLQAYTWVDMREGIFEGSLAFLLWGITGKKPQEVVGNPSSWGWTGPPNDPQKAPAPRASGWWPSWLTGPGLGILGLLVAIGTWQCPRSPRPKPELYAVRVQVLDPDNRPIEAAKLRTSAGNEPHYLPSDGWWQIEVPAVKVPQSGQITIWAEHPEWEGNHADLRLAADSNPSVEIHLKPPASWLRGRVTADDGHGIAGVRITREDGGPDEGMTQADGRFGFQVAMPKNSRVRMRAELSGWAVETPFCYTGSDDCPIILKKRGQR